MDYKLNTQTDLAPYVLIFLSCLLIFALRNSLNGVFYPNLLYEDGTTLFQPFYEGRGLGYIFEPVNGYLLVIPKLVAYLLNFLPAKLIPHSYALFAMVFAAVTFVVLFEMLQGYFGKRFALHSTLVIAALPLAYQQLITSLAGIIWNMLLILIFLYFMPVPKAKKKRWLYGVTGVVLIGSHPLSLLMLPLYVYKLRMDPENKWIHGLFVLSAILYFWFGITPKSMFFSRLDILPVILLGGVVVGSVFGPIKTASFIIYERLSICGAVILIFLFAFEGLFWSERTRREKELFFVSLYLIVSTVTISMLSGNYNYKLMIPWEVTRYLFVARILFWVLLISACLPLIHRTFNMIYLYALLIGLVLISNTIGPYNSVYKYHTSNKRGEAVIEFVNRIPSQKEKCSDSLEKEFVLKQGGTDTMFDVRVKGCDWVAVKNIEINVGR